VKLKLIEVPLCGRIIFVENITGSIFLIHLYGVVFVLVDFSVVLVEAWRLVVFHADTVGVGLILDQ